MFGCAVGREEYCKKISVACVGSARRVWTTLALPQLKAACAFRVYTALAPGCSAGCCPKWALRFMHFSGLSRSGSGSQVLHKGTDSVGRAFCALYRSEGSGDQVIGECTAPRGLCVLTPSRVPATRFPGCATRVLSQVSPLGS